MQKSCSEHEPLSRFSGRTTNYSQVIPGFTGLILVLAYWMRQGQGLQPGLGFSWSPKMENIQMRIFRRAEFSRIDPPLFGIGFERPQQNRVAAEEGAEIFAVAVPEFLAANDPPQRAPDQ